MTIVKTAMIGTPMSNDGPTYTYNYSLARTLVNAQKLSGLGISYLVTRNEITARARNSMAQALLASGRDKLFFIDSDMGWEPDDFFRILSSPHPIIAGIAPGKDYPLALNFTRTGDEKRIRDIERPKPEDLAAIRSEEGGAVFKVDLVGTAFMCIDRSVFLRLSEDAKPYEWVSMSGEGMETHWDFFPQGPIGRTYYPEDWGFCRLAKEAGFPIHIDSEVLISHMGNHVYEVPKEAGHVATADIKST